MASLNIWAWCEGVLAGGGVEHQPGLVRRTVAAPCCRHGATFFSSSIRSTLVCRRPAVSQMTTSKLSSTPRLMASKITEDGSPPSLPLTTGDARAVAPDLELLDRGGAEGVAGAEQHALALGAELGRELADGRGLADAVDADGRAARTACGARSRAAAASTTRMAMRLLADLGPHGLGVGELGPWTGGP